MNFRFSAVRDFINKNDLLKHLLVTASALAMTGCGVIQSQDPETEQDETPPAIVAVEPESLRSLKIDPNIKELKFFFSEALDPDSVSDAATAVNVTPAINYSVSYDEIESTDSETGETSTDYVLTVALAEDFAGDTSYFLSFGENVKDKASNLLTSPGYSFSTPKSFTVTGNITGLLGSLKISLAVPDQSTETSVETLELSGTGSDTQEAFSFTYRIIDQYDYKIEIEHQADTSGFCATANGSGTVNNGNGLVNIACDRVSPAYPEYSKWSDFGFYAGDTTPVHLGEKRNLALPESITSCDDIAITDSLGAFEWSCRLSEGTAIAYNTGFTDGKGLADLVDFSTLAWRKNKILVTQAGETVTVDSKLAVWWNNPIRQLPSGTSSLTESYTIYAAPTGQAAATITIPTGSDHVSLVTESSLNGKTDADGSMISVNSSYNWIEGDFAANTKYIINVNGSLLTRIHETVANGLGQAETGVLIKQSAYNVLTSVTTYDNTIDGISVQRGSNQDSGNNVLTDIVAVNNDANGISLDDKNGRLKNAVVAGNGANGIEVFGRDSSIHGVNANGNNGDGVKISGGVANFIANILSSANDGNGVTLADKTGSTVKTSQYNYLGNLTLTDNATGSVSVTTTGPGNRIENTVDAYNSGDACADAACVGVSTLASGDIDAHFRGALGVSQTNFLSAEYRNGADMHTSWNVSNNPLLATGNGACVEDSACESLDWSLIAASDFVNTNAAPVDTTTHTIAFVLSSGEAAPAGSVESPTNSFGNEDGVCDVGELCLRDIAYLEHTVEIMSDGIGNDNNLCEAGETCLFTPHTGSYQGHGTQSEMTATWSLTGVTVKQNDTASY